LSISLLLRWGAHQGALSDEDVTEVWLAAKSEAISKVRKRQGGAKGTEAPSPDEKEVEKIFLLSRPDGWVINKKTKRIIMLEFKRTSDTSGNGWWKFYL
jgi:hypothetical protein